MKKLLLCVPSLLLCCWFVGCGEPEDKSIYPKQDLKSALEAYYSGDYDKFFMNVDFGTELDSVQKQIMMAAYRRDIAYTNESFKGVRAIEPRSVEFEGDTVSYVLYDIVYGNQQRETSSQKMVKIGDSWKLRVRN